MQRLRLIPVCRGLIIRLGAIQHEQGGKQRAGGIASQAQSFMLGTRRGRIRGAGVYTIHPLFEPGAWAWRDVLDVVSCCVVMCCVCVSFGRRDGGGG